MPSASLHFRLPQDQHDFDVAQAGEKYLSCLRALDGYLRNRIKYGDQPSDSYQEVRDELHRIMDENRVEID